MKRDIDLAREILLDIEGRGADCSVSVLRTGPNHEAEEQVRCHLRLLIDAGLLKEVDRTAAGVPCVRLTHAGHELIELVRSEGRWREAKWTCHERTGGLSIAVIREILYRWAFHPTAYRRRRFEAIPELASRHFGRRVGRPMDLLDGPEWDEAADEDVRYVRVRPTSRNGWHRHADDLGSDHTTEANLSATLPDSLI